MYSLNTPKMNFFVFISTNRLNFQQLNNFIHNIYDFKLLDIFYGTLTRNDEMEFLKLDCPFVV